MNKKQAQLIKQYDRLSPTMQKIVQVSAALGAPISKTNLVVCASVCGAKDERGRQPNYTSLRDEMNAAINSGVFCHPQSKTGPIEIAPSIADFVFRGALESGLADALFKELEQNPWTYRLSSYQKSEATVIREMRVMFYKGDFKQWDLYKERCGLTPVMLSPFCAVTYSKRLSVEFKHRFLTDTIDFGNQLASDMDPALLDLIRGFDEIPEPYPEELKQSLIDFFTLRGDLASLKTLGRRLEGQGDFRSEIPGCIAFLTGDFENAKIHFEAAVKEFRKRSKRRTAQVQNIGGIFYGILLLKDNTAASQKTLKQLISAIDKWPNRFWKIAIAFNEALYQQTNPATKSYQTSYREENCPPIGYCFTALIWNWYFADHDFPFGEKSFADTISRYQATGFDWLVAEMQGLLAKMPKLSGATKTAKTLKDTSAKGHQKLETVSLVDLVQPPEPWEASLTMLENLCAGDDLKSLDKSSTAAVAERMIWEVEYEDLGSAILLTPFAQKLGKKGWSKGRKVGLSRLQEQWQTDAFSFLTEQDQQICRCLKQSVESNYYGYGETVYQWDTFRLMQAMVGHPLIFHPQQRDQPIEVRESSPVLSIVKKRNHFTFTVTPAMADKPWLVTEEGTHRISLTCFDNSQKMVARVIENMPPIPADQKDRIAQLSQSVVSVLAIESDIKGDVAAKTETTESDSSLVVQLTTYGDGLRAELFARPLGPQGPLCRPGFGAATIMASIDGRSVSTTRQLKTEKQNLKNLLSQCKSLDARTVENDQTQWLFHDSESALELVVELHQLAIGEQITVHWPRGKTIDVAGSANSGNFQVTVKRERDWFAVSGDLKIDDELTLDMMKLVEMVNSSPSRFLELDDGRFLALTQELRQRIADFSAFSKPTKNKFRVAPVRAVYVDQLLENTKLKSDKHWKSHLTHIAAAANIDTRPPSTLQAQLRDYQAEGFAWLKRLSHWTTGACLADDMGLGKTVQALSLLLDRATQGPALVIAPASVGFNWENETLKFAPSLTPKLFRNFDRTTFFEDLKPGDLAIASYGLLQSNADDFAKVQWATVMLDEAQAIKNMDTKRSQAAMQLQADFKVILTGTPLENHLGELWNLIRFLEPDLLGSHESFRKRFAIPIERDQCRQSRNRLRKLLQPFLLRRTKSEVLSELPSRTESVLEVEMSDAEVALYEAVRRKAIQNIESASIDASKHGQQHLQVLAELTRLRLACCHPSLVGGTDIAGSKLKLFRHTVNEIVEGNHKVLVFSQFVKHLSILRQELDQMGVSYQYLDGSTPAKKRQKIVESFQAGDGDVFLISLKAGGTGLNLTAADYVLHMDPWWNPAVEDQATDRAHRIGQTRPVNVYRLVTKGTIEEKIVELHNQKRDLADSLLSGTDISAKLSTEDLINLLKETSQPLTTA